MRFTLAPAATFRYTAQERPEHLSSSKDYSVTHLRASIAFLFSTVLCAALIAAPAFASDAHRPSATHRRSTAAHTRRVIQRKHTRHVSRRRWRHWRRRPRGQQAILPQRVTQIQEALIRVNYLTGPANGDWDAATVAAMQKYQADQGWQTKIMPDARALEKLGLGPDYSNALNAENSSSFDAPVPGSAVSPPEDAGFVAASGIAQ